MSFQNCKFIYPWRDYQGRLLKELSFHLEDDHLHLVAPPGSGKTVVGLEIAIRINQPTLILSPSIAIKNQWVQRLCELFLDTKEIPTWISDDIRNPSFLTVSTYQGLHAALKKDESNDEQSILKALKNAGIKTLIADEAHHLKNAWWKSLNTTKNYLKPQVVGLTATPPYDVSGLEWQRYITFNGKVDAEISVPQLIKNKDLCPHQDFVHFSTPTFEELSKLSEHQERMLHVFEEVKKDNVFEEIVAHHPVWIDANSNLEWIYSNLEKFSSLLIFLHAKGKEIPNSYLEIFGVEELNILDLDLNWMQVLLNFYLFNKDEYFNQHEEHQEKLEHFLKRNSAIEHFRVNLFQNAKIRSYLTGSLNKLNSIYAILELEHQHLGSDLRMVILTDYIRSETLIQTADHLNPINKMGVIPIFEKIRRNYKRSIKMVVLTGSIVIVPNDLVSKIQQLDKANHLSFVPLPFDANYLQVSSLNSSTNLVEIITHLFQNGEVELIIGTQALLGEGWDAPVLNTLILASFIGSFVMSNQMRGRAIRTDINNPDKVANIWHLVSVDPTQTDGGADLDKLRRRFRSFVGITYEEPFQIENGIDRLNIPDEIKNAEVIKDHNQYTFAKAIQREHIRGIWNLAIDKGVSLKEEIKIPYPQNAESYRGKKQLYWNLTLRNLLTIVLTGMGAMAANSFLNILARIWSFKSIAEINIAIIFALIMTFIYFGIGLYKTFHLYIKYRDITVDIEQICQTLLNSLIKINEIETPLEELDLQVEINQNGEIFCYLNGGNRYESALFIQSLEELLSPIENPRYIIIRKSKIFYFKDQQDYHNVPEVLGSKKAYVEIFSKLWLEKVGECDLIYTRNPAGRKTLLRAKYQAMVSQLKPSYEPVNIWK